MSDGSDENINQEVDELRQEVQNIEAASNTLNNMDEYEVLDYVYYLWMIWADFQLYIIDPLIEPISPPIVIPPSQLENGEYENVFSIHDEGFRLSCSRGYEGIALGASMLKFYNTIDKIVALLIDRMDTSGIDHETEVQVAFYGHELGQRKAFESIVNLEQNVIVTNFDQGEWGDRFMNTVLTLVDKGYGVPKSSPRKEYPGPSGYP